MLAWFKKWHRPVVPQPGPSDLEIANANFEHAKRKFNLALGEYRVGMIKIYCRAADREQLERIRDCRETKHL